MESERIVNLVNVATLISTVVLNALDTAFKNLSAKNLSSLPLEVVNFAGYLSYLALAALVLWAIGEVIASRLRRRRPAAERNVIVAAPPGATPSAPRLPFLRRIISGDDEKSRLLRQISHGWTDSTEALQKLIDAWHAHLNDMQVPGISTRPGMVRDSEDVVSRVSDSFLRELESLMKVLGYDASKRESIEFQATMIADPDELAHHYSRIMNLWGEVSDKKESFKAIEEYVQGFWDEFRQKQNSPQHRAFERMMPGQVGLHEEDIQKVQEQMVDSGKEWRGEMQKLIGLLDFRFTV